VAVNPGQVDTDLARGFYRSMAPPLTGPLLEVLLPHVLQPARSAAEDVVWACVAPEELVAGKYIDSRKAVPGPRLFAQRDDLASALYDKSLAWSGAGEEEEGEDQR